MSECKSGFSDELRAYKISVGTNQQDDCSNEENKQFSAMLEQGDTLPEGIYQHERNNNYELDRFYRTSSRHKNDDELTEYLAYKQLFLLTKQSEQLDSIKKMLMFFVALAIIGFLGAFIFALIM